MSNLKNDLLSFWEQWGDIHDDVAQQKRFKSACSGACTPLMVDPSMGGGAFQGKHGYYSTTLTSCTCVDFIRRKLPCKHIYRLALELDLIEGNFTSNTDQIREPIKNGLSFEDAIAIIETFPEKVQLLLKHIFCMVNDDYIYCQVDKCEELDFLLAQDVVYESVDMQTLLECYGRNEIRERIIPLNIPFNKNSSASQLVTWCMENIPDEVLTLFDDRTVVVVSKKYQPQRFKIYKYLVRKYDSTTIYIDESKTVPYLETDLPEDSITNCLRKYGYYKK